MLRVTGTVSKKVIKVPVDNIAFLQELAEEVPGYPKAYTRIHLKHSASNIKYIDCVESSEDINKIIYS